MLKMLPEAEHWAYTTLQSGAAADPSPFCFTRCFHCDFMHVLSFHPHFSIFLTMIYSGFDHIQHKSWSRSLFECHVESSFLLCTHQAWIKPSEARPYECIYSWILEYSTLHPTTQKCWRTRFSQTLVNLSMNKTLKRSTNSCRTEVWISCKMSFLVPLTPFSSRLLKHGGIQQPWHWNKLKHEGISRWILVKDGLRCSGGFISCSVKSFTLYVAWAKAVNVHICEPNIGIRR